FHARPWSLSSPTNRFRVTVVRPGDSARDTLEGVCKTHQLDPAAHYLRLRFLVENRLQVYVPQPEEDVYELLYQEIEICPKAMRSLQVEKSDAAGDSYEITWKLEVAVRMEFKIRGCNDIFAPWLVRSVG
ncbi:T-lymphoma invasion and metastasis-inducing protein 1-like, partial [Myotis lucifugus]|uniref:T-lymphoma invasion and metastasis-inducing protein 1-like n=1 Tax=Myotis lucifugus TaxID=59463 RepID=UPI000CCC3B8F